MGGSSANAGHGIGPDPRWQAVIARDRRFDGQFVYAVETTGIYCRPSCAARRANPENVRFYDTCDDAEQAGFRPCKRCRPNEISLASQRVARIAELCRTLDAKDNVPRLDELARAAGLSPSHFHRLFKATTGLSPKAYAAARRGERVRTGLAQHGATVTSTLYDAGFNSSGRFYETSDRLLGMTPTQYRAGGANTEIRFATGQCSLGSILVARSDRGICAILLGDDPDALERDLRDRFRQAHLIGGDAEFESLVAKVVSFVDTPRLGLDLPLDIRGTAFQQRVWQALREIPAGATASYAEVAKRLGSPRSARAVAKACAENTIAVAIPCHRVVRTDGALSGYRWGVARKHALLKKEGEG